MSEVTRNSCLVSSSWLLCMHRICWSPLEKLPGAKLLSLVAQLLLNPSLCRAWATAGPWAPWGTTNQARWGRCPELSWDRYVLPSRGDFLHPWPNRPQTPNTYCPALSNICPGQINFPWYIEIGFLSKRKPHERKVRGHVHLSVLPILFAVGSRANTWAEATFLLTCTKYQALSSGVLFF